MCLVSIGAIQEMFRYCSQKLNQSPLDLVNVLENKVMSEVYSVSQVISNHSKIINFEQTRFFRFQFKFYSVVTAGLTTSSVKLSMF